MRVVEIPPKPSSLVESMKEIGYSLGSALADIIDNCITAQARHIQLFSELNGADSRIAILDDGTGMTEGDLLEAMRLGSRSPLEERESSDLGRFGLGLKTASFSQCRVLTVVTRNGTDTACARWDLDRISLSDKWEVELLDDLSSIPWIDYLGIQGTLVIWERMGPRSDDENQYHGVDELVRQLDEACSHLELVFHRFMEPGDRRRRLRIEINNRPLEPFDPFNSRHPATLSGPEERIKVGHDYVVVRPFTLPHHSRVSTQEWNKYAGAEGYLSNQGFYVYRERRLIIHGTWFGLARQTELTKLTRIRVDIPNSLDEAWKIDVKKASAQLPPAVRDRLRRIIDPMATPSRRVYRSRGRTLTDSNRVPVWSRLQDKNEISYRINEDHPAIAQLISRLPEESQRDMKKVIEIAGASLPLDALFADIGGDPQSLVNATTSLESLEYAALSTFNHLNLFLHSRQDVLDAMKVAEPFRSNWEMTAKILSQATGEAIEHE